MIVPRTCTEIVTGDTNQHQIRVSQPLEDFRDMPAYVLLGDPGAGKTTAFMAECQACTDGHYTTARRFIRGHLDNHRGEWRGKTLFIDGLDEVRAGGDAPRNSLDQIITKLERLGKPPFRLSCRTFDWLGRNDHKELADVYQNAGLKILQLNPLTDSDIAELLEVHPHVDDAEAFIAKANRRGIGDLLRNPQTLDLLTKAVAGGHWPESRKETFEMACDQLICEHNDEHNDEHQSATGSPLTHAQLLHAAGRLCAVQLIAGKAGYTLHGKPDSADEYPTLKQYGGDHLDRPRLALATKLFKGVSDNRFTPVHRHIAEFLGARYLTQVIGEGLPARRVIALMTGADDGVVTELRGLSAWLAAHCQQARADIIERDPVGVGLYGDIRGFSHGEKRALLESLERDDSRIYPWLGPSGSQEKPSQASVIAFGALAAPDMEPALKEVLQDDKRNQGHQIFTDLVLAILSQAASLPCFTALLLEIVRDDTRWPRVKESALHAFLRHCPDSQGKVSKLKTLLADIQTGSVSDSDTNKLRGILLTRLYPDEVTPSEVWSYVADQENPEPFGKLWWLQKIVDTSSDKQVAEHLDHLQQCFSRLQPALELHHLRPLLLELLARGLRAHGDQLDTARLYDWLSVGEVGRYEGSDGEAADDIRSWLEQRPEVQKALCMEGLNRWPNSDDFNPYDLYQCLYRATLPSDFTLWCLKQAVAKANTEPRIAQYLLEMAFYWSGNEGLSHEILREHVQKSTSPLLKDSLEQWLASRPRGAKQVLRYQEQQRTFTEERQQREEAWLAHVRENEAALRENRAAPALLHQLSQFYFGTDSTTRGPKAVEEALRGDQRLAQAVLQGFRGAVDRQDVPTFEEILSLQAQGRMPYLAWPFLAGLAEIERTAPEDAARWDDERIRKALAFYYRTPVSGTRPAWYQQLLTTRPELVADVLVQCDAAEFRRGQEHLLNFSHLNEIWAPDHAQVAKHASLPLLRAFPIRCKLAHLGTLGNLLWAAIRYVDRPAFLDLIERKLARMSMNVGQRVYWLAAGLLVSSATYKDRLNNLVQGREKHILHLTDFLCRSPKRFLIDALEIPQLQHLLRLVGRCVSPVEIRDARFHTSTGHASGLVKNLIQDLATSPDKAAGDALASLLADPTLSRWHGYFVPGARYPTHHSPRRRLPPPHHRAGLPNLEGRHTRQPR